MTNLTDSDIIKALKCCGCLADVCDDCPIASKLKEDCKCSEYLAINALALINRQKAEIEHYEDLEYAYELLENEYKTVKAEAIKEFAERLKKRMGFCDLPNVIVRSHIDNLVKEMTAHLLEMHECEKNCAAVVEQAIKEHERAMIQDV